MTETVRLDKWLWAARFYKTRALAKQMINNGKVTIDQQKAKVSRSVSLGMCITLKQGHDIKTIIVTGLSDQRGKAEQAQQLYQETPASQAAREAAANARKLSAAQQPRPKGKPNKQDRAKIIRFNRKRAVERPKDV